MDLKIIRVKRPFESEPLEQLSVSYKRRKLDGPVTLSMVATVKSKDESLAPIIKDIILKCKEEKLLRLQEKKGLSHPNLYKYRTSKETSAKVEEANTAAAARRYQIVNKYRGISELDDDSEKFLASTDRFKIDLPVDAELRKDDTTQSAASPSQAPENANAKPLDIEIVDVDEVPNEEDVICLNGVPLQTTYLYDIFLTQVPQGCSVEDFDLSQAQRDVEDTEYVDSDDSEDSNAENYYTNDYPDEESSSSDEYEERDNFWDNELSSRMKRSLGFANDSCRESERKQYTFMGAVVPEHLSSMVDWGALQSDDDEESSIDGEQIYPDADDYDQE